MPLISFVLFLKINPRLKLASVSSIFLSASHKYVNRLSNKRTYEFYSVEGDAISSDSFQKGFPF